MKIKTMTQHIKTLFKLASIRETCTDEMGTYKCVGFFNPGVRMEKMFVQSSGLRSQNWFQIQALSLNELYNLEKIIDLFVSLFSPQ